MSPEFAAALDAACSPAPFASVVVQDIMDVSPDTALALHLLPLISAHPNVVELATGANGMFEDLDTQIELVADSARGRALSFATMLIAASDSPFRRPAEDINATAQLLAAESIRLQILTTLRNAMRASNPSITKGE